MTQGQLNFSQVKPCSPQGVTAAIPANQEEMPMRTAIGVTGKSPQAAKEQYPDYAGDKGGGASKEAADHVEKTGKKQIWSERCRALYRIKGEWTAEEGIIFYSRTLGLERLLVDKNLRPRFSELSKQEPPFLRKCETRRRSACPVTGRFIGGQIEVHPYVKARA